MTLGTGAMWGWLVRKTNQPLIMPATSTRKISLWLGPAWLLLAALMVAWLAAWAWYSRPLQPWAQGWVAWWTGDQIGSRPLWHFGTHLERAAEIVSVEGNSVFRIPRRGTVLLG